MNEDRIGSSRKKNTRIIRKPRLFTIVRRNIVISFYRWKETKKAINSLLFREWQKNLVQFYFKTHHITFLRWGPKLSAPEWVRGRTIINLYISQAYCQGNKVYGTFGFKWDWFDNNHLFESARGIMRRWYLDKVAKI